MLHTVVDFDQSMFAVIFTIGIWFRINIMYKPGYGFVHSFDWWDLHATITPQVTFVTHLTSF